MGNCCVRDPSQSLTPAEPESSKSEKAPKSVKIALADPAPTPTLPVHTPRTAALSTPHSTSHRFTSRASDKDWKFLTHKNTVIPDSSGLSLLALPVKLIKQPFEDLYETHSRTLDLPCGTLMLGTHRKTRVTRLVLKLDRPNISKEKEIMTQLAAIATLGNPNILKIDSVLCTEDEIFAVSEPFDRLKFVDYSTIAEMQSEAVVQRLAIQLLKALAYAHSQAYLFKSLSILNLVFYKGNDDNLMLKVIAMSGPSTPLATVLDSKQKGQLIYSAPEAWSEEFSEKADIWSCGVILFLLITNKRPFKTRLPIDDLKEDMRAGAKFSRKTWIRIDRRAQSLISAMLAVKPENRPTAVECLAFPWLQDVAIAIPSAMPTAMANLRRFKGGDPIKLSILTFMAVNVLSHEEKLPLEEVFAYINVSGTGLINLDELTQAFAQLHIQELSPFLAADVLRAVDTDNSGTIDFPEFLLASADYQSLLKPKRLKTAFDLFDPDSSGAITLEEFKAVLKYQGSEDVWVQFLREVDEDESGAVDLGEFTKLVRKLVGTVRS